LKQVVKIVDEKSAFDFESISIYTLFAGILGFILYFYGSSSKSSSTNTKKPKTPTAAVKNSSEETQSGSDFEWIPEHVLATAGKAKPRKKSK
jgi:hypothetical protein